MAADGHASTLAGRVGALVDRLARSPVASLAAIAVVALACYVPGFSTLPPLDGVEPGHMVAARAMVESGDYAAIRLQTANRTWSPRGAYWAEALAITLAGQGGDPPAWVYRLPSLIAAVAACLLTWWAAMAFGRPRAALLAGLLMAASGVAALMARQASPDSLTLAAATVAAGALARVWLGEARPSDSRLAWLFWAALGAGVLVNGLVLPATFAATIVLLSIERGQFGWLTRLRPRRGMVVLLVAIMPWALAVALTYLGGAAAEAPSAETLARLSVPFSLKAAPGTYILFTPLLLGPALAFLCLGMAWIVDDLRRPVVFFTLAWAGPLWLAAEFVEAKLPQVVLPVIPAIAIVTGAAIDAGAARVAGWARRLVSVGPVLWRWGLAFAAPFIFLALQGHFPFSAFLVFLLAAAAGIVAWLWLMRGEAVAAAVVATIGAALVYVACYALWVPGFDGLRIGERMAALVPMTVSCADPLIVVAGYPEESVVLATSGRTRIVNAPGAADFLNAEGCRVAAVDRSRLSLFRQRAEDLGLDPIERGRISGLNLRKTRTADIRLFTIGSAVR